MKKNLVYKNLSHNKIGIYNIQYFKRNHRNRLYFYENMNNISIKYSDSFIIHNIIKEKELKLFTSQIKNFLIKMYSTCSNFNGNIFFSNFKDTIFDIDNMLHDENVFIDQNCLGYFMTNKCGKVLYIGKFNAIFHELLHMASETNKDVKDDNSYILNKAETEGYTQLLTQRYASQSQYVSNSAYELLVFVMLEVEKLLGKNILEKEYFHGTFREYLNKALLEYGSFTEIQLLKNSINELYDLYSQIDKDMGKAKTNLILNEVKIIYINSMDMISKLFVNKIMRISNIEKRREMIEKLDFIIDQSIPIYVDNGANVTIEYNNRDIIYSTLKNQKSY